MSDRKEEKCVGLKGAGELDWAGSILKAGNSREYFTGSWRSFRPIWHEDRCKQCMFCWAFCPDSAIEVKDGKMTGINLFHCKGCGICAKECPDKFNAIEMIEERDAKE